MNIHKSITLETKYLNLRIPVLEDLSHIFSASRYAGFNDGMLWEPPKDKEELIKPFHRAIKRWEDGTAYAFTIQYKETDEFLGRISIRKTEIKDRWSVGFWTHPKYQKKGIMTRSLKAIIEFGFEKLDAKVIEAAYATWNKGSEKVLRRNGMKFVKLIDKGFQKNGKWIAENLLIIEKEEWSEFKKQ